MARRSSGAYGFGADEPSAAKPAPSVPARIDEHEHAGQPAVAPAARRGTANDASAIRVKPDVVEQHKLFWEPLNADRKAWVVELAGLLKKVKGLVKDRRSVAAEVGLRTYYYPHNRVWYIRYRLMLFRKCFVGRQLVDLLVTQSGIDTREQAELIGIQMLCAGMCMCATYLWLAACLFYSSSPIPTDPQWKQTEALYIQLIFTR